MRVSSMVGLRRAATIGAVATALLLAGCTDAPQTTAPATASESGVGPVIASSDETGSSTGSGTGAGTGSSTGSSVGPTTGSVDPRTLTPTSTQPSSRAPRSTPSSPRPSGTNSVGEFDESTRQFLSAMCSGLVNRPRDEFDDLPQDLAARKQAAGELFADQSASLTAAVRAMREAGTPDLPGGERLSQAVLGAYPKMAAAADQGAAAFAVVDSSAEFDRVFADARNRVTEAAASLNDLGEIVGAPAVAVQLAEIPSCKMVMAGQGTG